MKKNLEGENEGFSLARLCRHETRGVPFGGVHAAAGFRAVKGHVAAREAQ